MTNIEMTGDADSQLRQLERGLRDLVPRLCHCPLLEGHFIAVTDSQREPITRKELATVAEMVNALASEIITLRMANSYLKERLAILAPFGDGHGRRPEAVK